MFKDENLKGAALMSTAMAGFTLNDAIMKTVAGDGGIHLLQAIFIRGVLASILIGLFAYFSGAFSNLPNRANHILITWRSLAEVVATLSFLSALMFLPLANMTAILSVLPLTLTLAAALFMGESFGWQRGIAISVGFIGILLIIQPGTTGFNIYSLLGVFCVFCVTFRDLVVRQINKNVSNLYMAFTTAFAVALMGGVGVLIRGQWDPVSPYQLLALASAAGLIFIGYFCVVSAVRLGEVGFVSLFRYSGILWAIILGLIIWGELPNLLATLGILIVTATGLFTLWREQQIKQ